ncbi:hypothetical protein C770_GR4pB266 (plasmid) [Sinorhizobium meliloti GR4]|nr:hypothetical protein C770_GR4pB266 [Sinorhizobium meliloti GR4]
MGRLYAQRKSNSEGQRVEPIGGLSKGGSSFPARLAPRNGSGRAAEADPRPAGPSHCNARRVRRARRESPLRAELRASIQTGKRTCPGGVCFRAGPPLRPRNRLLCNHQAVHDRGVDRDHKRPVQSRDEACDPGRREALRSAFEDLREVGEEPLQHHVRTARAGEEITGTVLGHDDRVASLVTDQGIVVADRTDLPERLPDDEEIAFTARSDFSRVRREQSAQVAQSQAAPARQPQQDHNPELNAIEAQMAAQRSRERDDDDRGR